VEERPGALEGVGVSGVASVWWRRHVFVTGCTGFLGAWLSEWLVSQGAHVVGLVRDNVPRSSFYRGDLATRVTTVRGALEDFDLIERALNEYEIEVVFHLGAQTLVGIANENPRSTFSANVGGTWNVLEAARRSSRIRAVVVASSDKAYGTKEALPYREDAALVGRHPYDVSKSCADLIAQMYWHTYRAPVAVTRCGNFYGGGDLNFNRLVPGTIRSVVDGERPIVRSDGTLQRDYLYIKDAVAAYAVLAEKLLAGGGQGDAFNFSNESPHTVLEVVTRITTLMGRPDLTPVVLNQARHEIPHQYLSATKARDELGWKPQYGLDEGLGETIAWYREFLAR
jgi:CDP-glucose 4,6-dehydratase